MEIIFATDLYFDGTRAHVVVTCSFVAFSGSYAPDTGDSQFPRLYTSSYRYIGFLDNFHGCQS